jgi:hypothetical protein
MERKGSITLYAKIVEKIIIHLFLICGFVSIFYAQLLGSISIQLLAYFSFLLPAVFGVRNLLSRRNSRLGALLALSFLFPVFINGLANGWGDLKIPPHYLFSIFTAMCLARIREKVNWGLVLSVVSVVYCLFFIHYGDQQSLSVNRTFFTLKLSGLLLVATVSAAAEGQRANIVKYIIIYLLVALVTVNRASFLLSAALLALLACYLFFFKTGGGRTIIFRMVSVIAILMIVLFSQFINIFEATYSAGHNFDLVQRIQARGLDSGRFSIWLWYLNGLDAADYFFGGNSQEIQKSVGRIFFGSDQPHTLHNFLLQMHLQGGIILSIVGLALFYRLFKLFPGGATANLARGVVVLVFLKGNFEGMMFPGNVDWLYFLSVFIVLQHSTRVSMNIRNHV